jgi:hypothetical protein
MRIFASVAKTFALIMTACCIGHAQVTMATVSGVVEDPSGAVLPGSTLTFRCIETGSLRSTISDRSGRFVAMELEPGTYEIKAEKSGFAAELRSGILLTVGDAADVDFSLKVGPGRDSVVVEGGAALVETVSSSMGHVVERQEINDLPLNGRNYTQLTLLTPGVVDVTTFAASSFFGLTQRIAVAGSRPSSGGVYLLDGTNVMSFFNDNAGNPGLGTALGSEAIQEFKVETSTFGPQYARSGTSVINALSRSGSNQFQASAFEFIRNSALDARNYFDGPQPPSFRRNQFGVSAGGPIARDRAFFFGSYEGLRESLGESETGGSPTALARQGVLPSGNVVVNPAVVPLIDLFPLPNGEDLGGGVGELTTTASRETNEDYYSLRIDFHPSEKNMLFGRVIVDNGTLLDPYPLAGAYLPFDQNSLGRNRYVNLQATRVISADALNSLRVSFNRNNSSGGSSVVSPALNLIPGVTGRAPGAIEIGGVGYIGPNPIIPYYLILNTWTFTDDFSARRGGHFLKTGVEWQKIQDPYRADLYSGGYMVFNTLPDFLGGNPSMFLAPLPDKLNTKRTWNENVVGMYVSDSYRARKSLNLDLGVRYEFITNPTESNGRFSALLNLNDAAVTREPNVFAKNPSLKNIAPRIGFAWTVPASRTTAVRGGFGIFFQQYMPRNYAEYGFNPPETVLGVGIYPGFPISPETLFGLPPSISLVTGYDIKATPYMMEYNLNVQRELARDMVVQVGGVFSQGRKLLGSYDYNQPVPNATLPDGTPIRTPAAMRPNPYFSSLQFTYPINSSNYNSLIATLEKRFAGGNRVYAAYTWSHSLDTQSNEFNGDAWNDSGESTDIHNLKIDYGSSTFDVRHSLIVSYVLEIPVASGLSGAARALLKGWQTSGIASVHTGIPFSVENGFDRANTLQSLSPPNGSERPNLAPGFSNNPLLRSPKQWFDPNAFQLQPAGAFGNLGRDTVRGPNYFDFDAGIFRTLSWTEHYSCQLRFEVFNLLNHSNFAVPDFANRWVFLDASETINPQAGRITQTVSSSRQLQFAIRFNF